MQYARAYSVESSVDSKFNCIRKAALHKVRNEGDDQERMLSNVWRWCVLKAIFPIPD